MIALGDIAADKILNSPTSSLGRINSVARQAGGSTLMLLLVCLVAALIASFLRRSAYDVRVQHGKGRKDRYALFSRGVA